MSTVADVVAELGRRTRHLNREGRYRYQGLLPEESALVLIDIQNYFVTRLIAGPAVANFFRSVNGLTQQARRIGVKVVWVRTHSAPDVWENRAELIDPGFWATRLEELEFAKGEGWPLDPRLVTAESDHYVAKTRFSAFLPHPSELSELLESHGVRNVFIGGIATSTCCESSARDASMLDYRTIMVEDCLMDPVPGAGEVSLAQFANHFGEVTTSAHFDEYFA